MPPSATNYPRCTHEYQLNATKCRQGPELNGQRRSHEFPPKVLEWGSAIMNADIFKILAEEALGYNTVDLGHDATVESGVWALAGCAGGGIAEDPMGTPWGPHGVPMGAPAWCIIGPLLCTEGRFPHTCLGKSRIVAPRRADSSILVLDKIEKIELKIHHNKNQDQFQSIK